MSHKTRAEQMEVKARKDPKGLARRTKVHTPRVHYSRKSLRELMREIDNETTT
jgi:hypothetical protein